MFLSNNAVRAPSIALRWWAKLVRLIAFLMCTGVIGYFSWRIFQNSRAIPFWLAWIVVNSLGWLWEMALIIRRSPMILSSEKRFPRRHRIRIVWFSAIALLNFVLMLLAGSSGVERAVIVIFMLILYNVFTLAWLEYDTLRWFQWPKAELLLSGSSLLWIAISFIFGLIVFFSFRTLNFPTMDVYIDIGMGIMAGAISIVVFIRQRLEVEERAQADVIRDLSINLLGVNQGQEQWDVVVQSIGEKLRYRRVYILEPSMEQGTLKIVGQYGDYPNISGKEIPLNVGITGKAFLDRKIIAWNDVGKCSYYHSAVDNDDTKAEIALPIQYLGVPYGVLDVEDPESYIYHFDDIRTLGVIARILGAVISAQKTDRLVDDAYHLWEELSRESFSEEDIFREFAKFAHKKMGVDIIGYYPLSPAGYPISAPFVEGRLNQSERMKNPISRLDSLLFTLLREWRPQFIEKIANNPLFPKYDDNDLPHFSLRENVKSVCFIPIGTSKERLGAMFLNFRQERSFDGLFKFMILSFSQTFAILAMRNRYRTILFEGFGRPELGIHNLFSRYGLKTGIVDEGAKIFENSCRQTTRNDFSDCGMVELLNRVDNFLNAAHMVDASIPPLFWKQMLFNELEEYASTLPSSYKRGPKPTVTINIDSRIEREGAWVKLAIYRVVTEAMNNAVFHGATREISVKCERRDHEIWVQVTNDGDPLPESAKEKRSRRGIFSIFKELEDKFRAQTNIQKGEGNNGTVVDILIPAIPLSHEE